MSFQKYLQTISGIDPGNIYVENIRSVMNISSHKARTICEMAVNEDLFIRKVGLVCPNDSRIMKEFEFGSHLPEYVSCHLCEVEGIEPDTFKTSTLRKIVFYNLKE